MKRSYGLRNLICILFVTAFSQACHQPVTVTRPKPEIIPVKKEVIRMASDSDDVIYDRLIHRKAVYQFYEAHQFELKWLSDSVPNPLSDSLSLFLHSLRLYGLLSKDYHTTLIESLGKIQGRSVLPCREALLTDAFLSVAEDLKYGRLDSVFNPSRKDSLTFKLLDVALATKKIKETLESQEPVHAEYRLLKKSLTEILNNADSIDRYILFSGITFDSIPLHRKVEIIEINMERWRMEPAKLAHRYIWINIPSYQLRVVDGDQIILESKVIVGKPETPSPELSSVVECITVYPYWNVPRKIAVREFLPEIQNDASFLSLHNFEVLNRKGEILDPSSEDWQKYNENYFPIKLRQREGPENSLGVIKFVFDNPYAVFLHDTNAKRLFRNDMRALSHGCIRMEKAVELARYLVPEPDKMEEQLALKERISINLHHPIPIFIRYYTCEYINGMLNFYDDIYQKDEAMISLIYHAERAPF